MGPGGQKNVDTRTCIEVLQADQAQTMRTKDNKRARVAARRKSGAWIVIVLWH